MVAIPEAKRCDRNDKLRVAPRSSVAWPPAWLREQRAEPPQPKPSEVKPKPAPEPPSSPSDPEAVRQSWKAIGLREIEPGVWTAPGYERADFD